MPLVNPPAVLFGRVYAIVGARAGRYEVWLTAVSLSVKAKILSLAAGETCDGEVPVRTLLDGLFGMKGSGFDACDTLQAVEPLKRPTDHG